MKPQFESPASEREAEINYLNVGEKFTDDNGVEWKVIYDDQNFIGHRWYWTGFVVVQSVNQKFIWGHFYVTDNSESQDGQFSDYWTGDGMETEWFPVKSKQIITWEPA